MNLAMFVTVIKSLDTAKVKLNAKGHMMYKEVEKLQYNLTKELLSTFEDINANPKDALTEAELKNLKCGWCWSKNGDGIDKDKRYFPQKISTIRMVRDRTGYGLLEAKQLVEQYETGKHECFNY